MLKLADDNLGTDMNAPQNEQVQDNSRVGILCGCEHRHDHSDAICAIQQLRCRSGMHSNNDAKH